MTAADLLPDLITAIVGALAILGPALAWWFKRRDNQKDPVPKKAAEIALSAQAIELTETVVQSVRTEMSRLSQRIGDLEETEATLKKTLTTVIEDRSRLIDYVREWWRWWNKGANTSPPLIPDHLTDVITDLPHKKEPEEEGEEN